MASLPAPALAAATSWFEENFLTRGELGASVSVWKDGVQVLSLSHGQTGRDGRSRPWTSETLVPVWSATKGPAAVACLLALHEAQLELDCPVVEVWPEFVGGGKEGVTFAHVLSHTSGLCILDEPVPIFDYDAVIRAIEQQTPRWPAGSQVAYQPRTFGFLLDEIVRRLTAAESLGHYFDTMIRAPMHLDFWIGLPASEWTRVSPVYPGKFSIDGRDQPFLRAFNAQGSVTQRALNSPLGLSAVSDMNQSDTWARGFPAMGGVGTAGGLGAFYAMLASGGEWNGRSVVPPAVVQQCERMLAQGDDPVLCTDVAFSAGMMKDPLDVETGAKSRALFGSSLSAFGHPGAGGSLAFADPENGVAFAYTMNQMEFGVLPGAKVQGIVNSLYEG